MIYNKNICLFVHGSHHGAWCWRELDKKLTVHDLTKIYVDLPGHGKRIGELSHYSLRDYVNSVIEVIKNYSGPVTLIGHSFGGVVISQIAERIPERIKKLIYVCAFLLPNGYNTSGIIQESGFISTLAEEFVFDETQDVMQLSERAARNYFFNECPEELIQYAVRNLCDEPLTPTREKISITKERFGRCPKFYIKTLKDKAIMPELQDYMIHKNGNIKKTYMLDADHSPFFSAISELSDTLKTIIMNR